MITRQDLIEKALFEEIEKNKEHYRNAMKNSDSDSYQQYFHGNLYAYEMIEILLNRLLNMSRQELLQRKEKIEKADAYRKWEKEKVFIE